MIFGKSLEIQEKDSVFAVLFFENFTILFAKSLAEKETNIIISHLNFINIWICSDLVIKMLRIIRVFLSPKLELFS